MEEGKATGLQLLDRIRARLLGYWMILLGFTQAIGTAVSAFMATVYMACVSGPLNTAAACFSVIIGWLGVRDRLVYSK